MSRERPRGCRRQTRAGRDFNEARLHEPGEASGRPCGMPWRGHFNEARLHEPGEAVLLELGFVSAPVLQ